MNKQIPITWSSIPLFEEYVDEIKVIWDRHRLTNMGAKYRELQTALAAYLKIPHMVLFANGHLALESAIATFDLKGEVITTPFTFISTTHAIVRQGLKPVFCDISSDNYTIDVDKLGTLINENTCAIVPVHVYGNICDFEAIEKIAKRYNLKVIYDAAHAFGVTIDGKGIGNCGDASMFSFHATKVFNTIEGGGLAFKDSSMEAKLEALTNFGITGTESVNYISGNAKMNEFQAAMGLCNLRHVNKEIEKRKTVVDRYYSNLIGTASIKLIQPQPGINQNFAYFPVVFDGYKKTRDEIDNTLKENNIYARKYFYPLTSKFECYRNDLKEANTPVAEYIAQRVLCLPLYGDLALEDVDRICTLIKK